MSWSTDGNVSKCNEIYMDDKITNQLYLNFPRFSYCFDVMVNDTRLDSTWFKIESLRCSILLSTLHNHCVFMRFEFVAAARFVYSSLGIPSDSISLSSDRDILWTNQSGIATVAISAVSDPGNIRGCGLDGQVYPLLIFVRLVFRQYQSVHSNIN